MYIKPTADKQDVFQFKANFLRLIDTVEKKELREIDHALNMLVVNVREDSGIPASARVVFEKMLATQKCHADACMKEISELLNAEKKEMGL
jgi:hypothetical protein